ncbi:hypothetical protein BCR34DRAFT_603947 [Clohesyomyces aquaticus]|uniref:CFEM domain-containing protein n=1 Tax=Clohesyomyces aquaticus TaxID=1231657 RepID=A0A1Y1ZAK2_9PLEO|nr:hypothetical protein BCR34DRAFT_603947 [Clohesyomyces aquaticus]
MKVQILLPALTIAGLTYAQYSKPSPAATPGLPDCSHTCLDNNKDPSGQCWAVDLACVCSSFPLLNGFLEKFGDCLLQECNEDDITAFVQVLINTCISVIPVVPEPTSPSKNLLHLKFVQPAKRDGYSLHITSLAVSLLAPQTTTADATTDATTDAAAMRKSQTPSTESFGIEIDTAPSPTPNMTGLVMFMPSSDASGGITSVNGTGTPTRVSIPQWATERNNGGEEPEIMKGNLAW